MINVHVTYDCKEKDNRDQFLKELKPIGKNVESEPGNQGYHYYYDTEDEAILFLWEQWENQEYLDEHSKGDNVKMIGELKQKYGVTSNIIK